LAVAAVKSRAEDDLLSSNEELARFNSDMVGRELPIVRLSFLVGSGCGLGRFRKLSRSFFAGPESGYSDLLPTLPILRRIEATRTFPLLPCLDPGSRLPGEDWLCAGGL
jgi:hypothetical protein